MKTNQFSAASVIVLLGGMWSSSVWAVPSFARQTGMTCAACHTQFPELTPFGRNFKLSGYTLTTQPTVEEKGQPPSGELSLGATPPISAMVQISSTSTRKAQPDSAISTSNAQNGSALFPQQLSLFYAGRITPKIGSFIQFTYDGNEDTTTIDNTDIRFADTGTLGGQGVTYGLTLNNNPTVQDLWNSTPAWGIPFASSPVAPSPAAATLLDGKLGQQVGGIGPYIGVHLGSDLLYGELTLYRAAQPGKGLLDSSAAGDKIDKSAPYARVAYEHNWDVNSWEVGALALNAHTTPTGVPFDASQDKRKDVGVDTQLQHLQGRGIYSVNAIYLRETQDWVAGRAGSGANPNDTLETFKVSGSYYYARTYGAILQYFQTKGDADAGLYPAGEAVSGSESNKPDSAGLLGEVLYTPWENTRFALQYVEYNKFNGGKSNYDGAGRNAKDNNTLYLVGWFMW